MRSKTWRYKLDAPFVHKSVFLEGVSYQNEWTTIENGTITVNAGYCWDGCSPSWNIPGTNIWLGTPDGELTEHGYPESFFASCVHDVLCQFRNAIRIDKHQTVYVFKELLLLGGFSRQRASLYADAVWYLGPQNWLGLQPATA